MNTDIGVIARIKEKKENMCTIAYAIKDARKM